MSYVRQLLVVGISALLLASGCGGGDESGGGSGGKKDGGTDGATGGTGGGGTGGGGTGGGGTGGGGTGGGGTGGGGTGGGGTGGVSGGGTGGVSGGGTGGIAGGGTGGIAGGGAGGIAGGGGTAGAGGQAGSGGTAGAGTGGTGGTDAGTGGAGAGGQAGAAGADAGPQCQGNTDCDNGTYCDGVETCVGGQCVAGTPIVCASDGKTCTTEVCEESTQSCQTVYADSVCQNNQFCDGPEICDPSNPAANNSTGCAPGTPPSCDDGIACTTNGCDEANDQCTFTVNNAYCNNNQFCDGAETCAPGASGSNPTTGCLAGAAPVCQDAFPCTQDSCNETTDQCDNLPQSSVCNDGVFCNGVEVCSPTQGCQPGTAVSCPNTDGIACTVEACDESSQSCQTTIDNTKCQSGQICVPSQGGCIVQACVNDGQCSDGDACNGIETCNLLVPGGQCVPGTPVSCSDGISCTLDECNPANAACTNTPINSYCNDGNVCNGTETCSPTLDCVGGTQLTCDDGVSCTVDICISSFGCAYIPNDQPCQDSSQCNGDEVCDPVLGCQAAPSPLQCPDDGIACTNEVCIEGIGCQSKPDNANCGCNETCLPTQGGCSSLCTPGTCQGKLYACGDCLDNDGDCKTDAQDPHCIGPCSDNEEGFKGEISGQNNAACKMDCYFDQDSGSGNDDCHWNHKCDPNEPQAADGCAYDPGFKFPGNKSCSDYSQTQPPQCLSYCGPLVPNGCDCFGCCVFPQVAYPVYLGSSPSTQAPGTCNMNTLTDPTQCHQCVQVPACLNTCGNCELCVGKPTLPPECTEQDCPVGIQKCGLPGQLPCPPGEYCVTGCCQDVPQ